MRLAVVQYNPKFGEVAENTKRILAMLQNASFELAVLPELFATGYLFTAKREVVELAEPIPNGDTCRTLLEYCKSANRFLAFGLAEKSRGKYYNSAVLIGPKGLLIHYRKIHLFGEEKKWFSPGNLPLSTASAAGAKVGMMICFDWRFPEVTRTLALKGAEVIAHPSNLVMPHCPDAMVTRALENAVFCATADRTGTERRGGKELAYIGQSEIVDPSGKILVRLGLSEEGIGCAQIDPKAARVKKINAYNDIVKDRRPALYA